MKIAIVRERANGETRVAATPEIVTRLKAAGADVAVEKGAGEASRYLDSAYADAGATLASSAAEALKGADVVLTVRRPDAALLKDVAKGALVIGALDPYGHEGDIAAIAGTGVSAFAMEFMPRITRAQVMDILSSQANLAGYQAVIEAATLYDRALPMMMTAAGTVRAAKVFVMGAGVAGLQAIATARRLGAAVTATDVRAAAGEQVESLGAKFIMTDALKDASGEGGYARELTAEEQAAQAELVAKHIANQDIVITTALIPGRPAPKLVSTAMVESMAPGSVIVDLATERGGNVEVSRPGEIVTHNGVSVIGFTNMAGRLPATASQLYAKNLQAFLGTLIDKDTKAIKVDWEDELVKATLLTRDGAVVHPNIKAAADAAPAPVAAKPAAAKPAAPAKTGAASKTARKTPAAPAEGEAEPAAPAKTGAASKTGAAGKTRKSAAKATPAEAPAKAGTAASKTKKAPARKPAADKDGGQ